MNRSVWARSGIAAAAMLMLAMGHVGVAHAEDDGLSLKIAKALRGDRLFMRAGAIFVKVKTKSGDTYDVTGPVMTKAEFEKMTAPGATVVRDALVARGVPSNFAGSINSNLAVNQNGLKLLVQAMNEQGLDALGTPPGIQAVAKENMSTAGFSIGSYLSDEHTWMVEAYVLAAPLTTSVTAKGRPTVRVDDDKVEYQQPFGLQGQKILSTKLLPPLLMFGRYWGERTAKFRLYTGMLATYSIFYDTKATEALNSYVGGSNPGDTTVSLKNAFGVGPMLGFKYQVADGWHVNFNLGSVKLKTQGTLVTRNTNFTRNSGAIEDFGRAAFSRDADGNLIGSGDDIKATVSDTIRTGELLFVGNQKNAAIKAIYDQYGGVAGVSSLAVAHLRGQKDLGTYVRKADTTLTTTMFMLNVGHDF